MMRSIVTACACAMAAAGARAERGFDELPGYESMRTRWIAGAAELGVPGFAVALVRDGEIAAIEGFGVRNAAGDPVDPDTMFYIASCTKTYLAMGVCALVDDGRLALDTPVQEHVPEFDLADPRAAETVTLRDLLSHRRGLECGPAVMLDAYTGQITDERYFHWLAKETPHERVEYTNTHFTLAGRVIERVTGRSWRDALDTLVFEPAGLDRTTGYASAMYDDVNCALPMEESGEGFAPTSVRKTDATMHAAGGMGTTARDAARWLMLSMGGGAVGGERVVSERMAKEMLTYQSRFPETRGSIRAMEGFGLGWQLGTYRGTTPLAMHGGGYIGTAALLAFMPEKKIGLVVLANASPGGNALADVLSVDVFDHELGVEDPPDLMPPYIERIDRYRERRASEETPDMVTAADLGVGPNALAGRYENEHLGSIEIEPRGEEFAGRIGALGLSLVEREGDGEPGAFDVLIESGSRVGARLERDGDRVDAILIEVRDGSWARFERTG